jgi:hypothetical protein
VADGLKLNSEQLLLPLTKIGELDADGYRAANSFDLETVGGSKQ